VTLPLLEFPLAKLQGEGTDHFLAKVELGVENMVGSYGHVEHDACIKALPNGGRLNQVFEKASVAYVPHLEPGNEVSTEAAKKRKVDACVQPAGKWVKVAKKKKVASALKPAAVSKPIATSKATAAPKILSVSKTAAAVKTATTSKIAGAKALVAPRTVTDAGTSKAATAGQKGASGMTKVGMLKIKAGVKRPTNAELLLAEAARESKKLSLSLSAILALTLKVVTPSPLYA
jgi:hypothetical protein